MFHFLLLFQLLLLLIVPLLQLLELLLFPLLYLSLFLFIGILPLELLLFLEAFFVELLALLVLFLLHLLELLLVPLFQPGINIGIAAGIRRGRPVVHRALVHWLCVGVRGLRMVRIHRRVLVNRLRAGVNIRVLRTIRIHLRVGIRRLRIDIGIGVLRAIRIHLSGLIATIHAIRRIVDARRDHVCRRRNSYRRNRSG